MPSIIQLLHRLSAVCYSLSARAGVAKQADAPDSKSGSRKGVGVRFPSPAPSLTLPHSLRRTQRDFGLLAALSLCLAQAAKRQRSEEEERL